MIKSLYNNYIHTCYVGFLFTSPLVLFGFKDLTRSFLQFISCWYMVKNTNMACFEYQDVIEHMVQHGQSYNQISDHLKSLGVNRGVSVESIRKFCKSTSINPRQNLVSDEMLTSEVSKAIQQVCTVHLSFLFS